MKEEPVSRQRPKEVTLRIVSPELLANRRDEIAALIAQRAYQLFEGREFQHGKDLEDWLQAESEIVHWCRHDLRETDDAVILRAEMPSSYPASQLFVSVEPWRLIISGEKDVEVRFADGVKTGTGVQAQRIFRAHDLPVEVNPSAATAILRDSTLEVIMPKADARTKRETRSASSGG